MTSISLNRLRLVIYFERLLSFCSFGETVGFFYHLCFTSNLPSLPSGWCLISFATSYRNVDLLFVTLYLYVLNILANDESHLLTNLINKNNLCYSRIANYYISSKSRSRVKKHRTLALVVTLLKTKYLHKIMITKNDDEWFKWSHLWTGSLTNRWIEHYGIK